MALGRPKKAAQSLAEALELHYAGLSPKRPRNEFERDVMRKQRGRSVNPKSLTQVAAAYAAYLVKADGLPLREASRIAALAYKVKADSVRKPARQILRGPQSTIVGKINTWAGQSTTLVKRPLVYQVRDFSADFTPHLPSK